MTPSSYKIECFNRQHHVNMLVNNATFSLELLGLVPSTLYNCCVSAVYGSYTARGVYIETATFQPPTTHPSSESPMVRPNGSPTAMSGAISTGTSEHPPSETVHVPGDISTIKPSNECPTIQLNLTSCQTQGGASRASSSVDTVGGVLGFIIAVLLILLAISGTALVCLLRPKFLRNVFPKQ